MRIFEKVKKCLIDENGSTIVEASFIFPAVIIVLFFMMFFANTYYVRAQIDSIVMDAANKGASLCGSNLLNSSQDGNIPSLSKFHDKGGAHPYRYIFNSETDVITDINEEISKKFDGHLSLFAGYEPKIKNKGDYCEYNNYILYSTFSVNVEYEVKFNILSFFGEVPTLEMSSYSEEPVSGASELIRNMDMLNDYFFKFVVKDKTNFADYFDDLFGKVSTYVKDLFKNR